MFSRANLGSCIRRRLCQFSRKAITGWSPALELRTAGAPILGFPRPPTGTPATSKTIPWRFTGTPPQILRDIWHSQVGKIRVSPPNRYSHLARLSVAKTDATLAVTEPSINPDTGFPIIRLRIPIFAALNSVGAHCQHDSGCSVCAFLDRNEPVRESTTFVGCAPTADHRLHDRQKGRFVSRTESSRSHPGPNRRSRHAASSFASASATVTTAESCQLDQRRGNLIAALHQFPECFGQPCRWVTLTTIGRFRGNVEGTNRVMMGS